MDGLGVAVGEGQLTVGATERTGKVGQSGVVASEEGGPVGGVYIEYEQLGHNFKHESHLVALGFRHHRRHQTNSDVSVQKTRTGSSSTFRIVLNNANRRTAVPIQSITIVTSLVGKYDDPVPANGRTVTIWLVGKGIAIAGAGLGAGFAGSVVWRDATGADRAVCEVETSCAASHGAGGAQASSSDSVAAGADRALRQPWAGNAIADVALFAQVRGVDVVLGGVVAADADEQRRVEGRRSSPGIGAAGALGDDVPAGDAGSVADQVEVPRWSVANAGAVGYLVVGGAGSAYADVGLVAGLADGVAATAAGAVGGVDVARKPAGVLALGHRQIKVGVRHRTFVGHHVENWYLAGGYSD